MHRLLLYLLIIIPLSLCQAQDSVDMNNSQDRMGILFMLEQLSLNSYGGGLGLKYLDSPQIGYTGKLVLSFVNEDKEKSRQLYGEKKDALQIGLGFGFEKHLARDRKLSPFFCSSIDVLYERTSKSYFYGDDFGGINPYGYGYDNETEGAFLLFQLNIGFGLEYRMDEHISLSARYMLGSLYRFGKEKIVSVLVDDERDVSSFTSGLSSAAVVLCIYL